MEAPQPNDRLSRIETLWSVVRQAHAPGDEHMRSAQQGLLDRYGGAVRRYALAALRNEDAAEEVFQEFAVKFLRGDLGRADPDRGRFRSFVKTTVYHLIVDHQRRRKRDAREANLGSATPEAIAPTDQGAEQQHEELFAESWRDDLLARVWEKLAEQESKTGKPHHTALKCRVENPEMRSPQLAEAMSQRIGKPIKAGAARVMLHRAREAFAELMLEEVSHSLPEATPDAVQEELIDLNLFEYCRPIFEKRKSDAAED